MKSMAWSAVVAAALIAGSNCNAESAQDILEDAWDAQVNRWEGLDSYLVEQSIMGHSSKQYFIRSVITDAAGTERTMFLPAPDAALEPGCVNTATLTTTATGTGDNSAEYMSWFINSANLVGETSVDGKDAWEFRANDLEMTESMGDEEVRMNSMSMWLSKGDYLPLKTRMEGEAMARGQSRAVSVETNHSDFRSVPGSKMVQPFRRAVNVSGILGGVDAEQIAAAQAQMADLEKQMASMPKAQREMMEKMVGPQLETLRKMGETGGLETDIVIDSITANPEAFGKPVAACDPG